MRRHELGSLDFTAHLQEFQFRSMSALEILKETFRILRYNSAGFAGITSLLICPVSAISLSNVLVDHSLVKRLTLRLLLIANASGLPLNTLLNQSCQRFSDMAISTIMCFPLYITLLLLSKGAIVYSVDCSYSKKQFNATKFHVIARKLYKRVVSTYIWSCMMIVGVIAFFLVLLVVICNIFLIFGFSPNMIFFYPGVFGGLVFSVVYANAIIICNVAIVIAVLEDAWGPQALLRSSMLIRGQTQVGLLMYLGSTIGMAFVQGLFEHMVKTLSYGDGHSGLWQGAILVVLYSLVVLIDSMMTAVFYFSCRSLSMESACDEESQPILELMTASPRAS